MPGVRRLTKVRIGRSNICKVWDQVVVTAYARPGKANAISLFTGCVFTCWIFTWTAFLNHHAIGRSPRRRLGPRGRG